MRRLIVLAVLAATALAPAGEAAARIVESQDNEGRTITFDVRASNVDVEWYAGFLRSAAHENEIERVTIRIIPAADIAETCGAEEAGGCYTSNRQREGLIVVPALKSSTTAHALLHEYGHHLDRWRGVAAAPREPNGTAHWWEARGIARLLAAGEVAFDYSRGWSRSIAEIFAEDYAYLHLQVPWRIDWLSPPGESIREALRQDVAGVPDVAAVPPPLVIVRSGSLRPRQTHSVPFGLLGPGRRVTASVSLAAARRRSERARLVLRCAGRTVTVRIRGTRSSASIDERDLGPAARCSVALHNTHRIAQRFTLRVRLAIE